MKEADQIKSYAIVILLALCALGCEFNAHVESGPKEPAKPTFWRTLTSSPRAPGPYTYITREPVLLPDGTTAVCIATLKDLWCKEVK
jgi:hypothetical protein